MPAEIKTEQPVAGEFIARFNIARTRCFDSGVLLDRMEPYVDGMILMRVGDYVTEWDGDGQIIGILMQPDRAEVRSGRNRCVFVARDVAANPDKLIVPTGLEETAFDGLEAIRIYTRPESLPR